MKLKTKFLSVALYALSLNLTPSFAATQTQSSEFDLELFTGSGDPRFDGPEFVEQLGDEGADGENETVPLTKGLLKTITQRVAENFEKHFFSRSSEFLPSWDTSKIQVLLVNQSSDFAYLLNNQNKTIDEIGARIEYSARTLNNNDIKVNAFGKTELNGVETYFYNVDTFVEFGVPTSIEATYAGHMTTAIHEAIHILVQTDAKSVDMIDPEQVARGVTFPIDIASRHYRNESAYYLYKSAGAKSLDQKKIYMRNALYFHQKYLAQDKKNKGHDEYDYAEGMAEYVTTAATVVLEEEASGFDAVHTAAKNKFLEINKYTFSPKEEQFEVLEWSREYYDIGALAYAAAIDLGHKEILAQRRSPFNFLAEKYTALKVTETEKLKETVYNYYGRIESVHNARRGEIARVLNDPNNVLIELEEPEDGSMQLDGDTMIYDYDGKEGSFEIRTQEIKFGDNRIKLAQQHALAVMPDMEDFGELEFEPGAEDGQFEQAEMNDEQMFDDDFPFPMGHLLIPVNKNQLEVNGDRLTIQNDHLVMFDVKFEKKGRTYKLVKN